MCGIAGVAGALAGRDHTDAAAIVTAMTDALQRRGPDAEGLWMCPDAPLVLGHRRLSVLDPSPTANQPLVEPGLGGGALTFNGEVFNFREIRARLGQGHAWTTEGDSEVLLAACRSWGPERTVRDVRGMFAFAYFDRRSRTLWLARDRFGEKPLYYAIWNGTIAFASELKALRTITEFPTALDIRAIDEFMRRSVIGGGRTVYQCARKVEPGTLVRVPITDWVDPAAIEVVVHWDAVSEAEKAMASPFTGGLDDAADAMNDALFEATRLAAVSDVPLGALLSGGIDSSVLVSQLAGHVSGTLRTFTVGFSQSPVNETTEARRIAQHFGTDHAEVTIGPRDALSVVPELPCVYDEPFADSSQIPTLLVTRFASQKVTVALVGDGGDELFAGYPRYRRASSIWQWLQIMPPRLRTRLADMMARPDPELVERLGHRLGIGPTYTRSGGWGERLGKASTLVGATSVDEVYRMFVTSFWDESPMSMAVMQDIQSLPKGPTSIERMMLADLVTYLPDDLLTKVDRAAMWNSLETRVPFLDPDVYRLAQQLPLAYKASGQDAKLVLKRILEHRIPREFWDRPKVGFGIPLGAWLRGPLRPWAEDLLSPSVFARHGLLDEKMIRRHWVEHLEGRRNWGSRMWNVITFQAWYQHWMT